MGRRILLLKIWLTLPSSLLHNPEGGTVLFGSLGIDFRRKGYMALDYIQPAVQVRKVAKLLELVTIRVKRGEIPETLESSRETEETGLEISPPSTKAWKVCDQAELITRSIQARLHQTRLRHRPGG